MTLLNIIYLDILIGLPPALLVNGDEHSTYGNFLKCPLKISFHNDQCFDGRRDVEDVWSPDVLGQNS
jgi:hypothetical protein